MILAINYIKSHSISYAKTCFIIEVHRIYNKNAYKWTCMKIIKYKEYMVQKEDSENPDRTVIWGPSITCRNDHFFWPSPWLGSALHLSSPRIWRLSPAPCTPYPRSDDFTVLAPRKWCQWQVTNALQTVWRTFTPESGDSDKQADEKAAGSRNSRPQALRTMWLRAARPWVLSINGAIYGKPRQAVWK